ncbi:MAG: phosphoadenosine phosphosulfate reductase [Alistipes sp.]|nr:phosphoadenosine phosphosulfate reductase [Alistipes sp.]
MNKVRHVLGISGGKDSAALAIYLKRLYPQLPIEYYNSDTKCELAETEKLIENLKSLLGHIELLIAAKDSPEPTPFDHFLKISGGYLPSPQARWCTQKMKLAEFEKFVGDTPAISYVGIRGDEDREGYVSTKPNIQAIFPFRKNIWSVDVVHNVLHNSNISTIATLYKQYASKDILDEALQIIEIPTSKSFLLSRKINALLDLSVKTFNRVVFEYLKTTDYPVGKLDEFPLIDNEDVLVKADIFKILEDSGVGIPAYYNPIPFEVDGKTGTYSRSRSGCYFCFFQQRIEWIWLLEQHPELYKKAMEYEKDGYTWIQGETLEELSRPERVRQIKLDHIKKQAELKAKSTSGLLVDMFDDYDEIPCANCFI